MIYLWFDRLSYIDIAKIHSRTFRIIQPRQLNAIKQEYREEEVTPAWKIVSLWVINLQEWPHGVQRIHREGKFKEKEKIIIGFGLDIERLIWILKTFNIYQKLWETIDLPLRKVYMILTSFTCCKNLIKLCSLTNFGCKRKYSLPLIHLYFLISSSSS